MKLLALRYVLEAFELARSQADGRTGATVPDEALSARPSREDIALAWRRWGLAEHVGEGVSTPTDGGSHRGRGLALPAPRTGI